MVHALYARIPPVSYGQKVLFWNNRSVQREKRHMSYKNLKKVKKMYIFARKGNFMKKWRNLQKVEKYARNANM